MRILTLADTKALANMELVLDALEPVYADMANGAAGNIPRADLLAPHADCPEAFHAFKTMSGSVPRYGTTALRLNSDVVHWPGMGDQVRRVKIPAAAGDRWVGLVLLFDMGTGEPRAIFPDGYVQRMRVGAAGGLSSKYLANKDASTLAVLGSGWQAGAQVLAHCAVRPITAVRVWSPSRENRERFARELSVEARAHVQAVDEPQAAVADADIVACATNALAHVFQADWLQPGMHLTNVRMQELPPEVYARSDRVFVHSAEGQPQHHFVGDEGAALPELQAGWFHPAYRDFDLASVPTLADLIAGKANGRQSTDEITSFVNNIGLGTQFAAVGAKMLEKAQAEGIGHELPLDWFLQDVHP